MRDTNINHLYPPFASLVVSVLQETTFQTTGKHGISHWILFEGFRSQGRQDDLYSQGRTAPGSVVTHLRVSNHTYGIAADCVPIGIDGSIAWDAHNEIWEQYGHVIREHKEIQWGGDYPRIYPGSTFTDFPHMELKRIQKALWYLSAKNFLRSEGLV